MPNQVNKELKFPSVKRWGKPSRFPASPILGFGPGQPSPDNPILSEHHHADRKRLSGTFLRPPPGSVYAALFGLASPGGNCCEDSKYSLMVTHPQTPVKP